MGDTNNKIKLGNDNKHASNYRKESEEDELKIHRRKRSRS
jgi:hypothetical protein